MGMNVHIGQLIKRLSWERHLTTAGLAEKLGVSRQSVYGLFRRKDVHTRWFGPLGEVLGHDFAQHYLSDENRQRLEQGDDEAEALRREIEALRKENEMLRELNGLLKKK